MRPIFVIIESIYAIRLSLILINVYLKLTIIKRLFYNSTCAAAVSRPDAFLVCRPCITRARLSAGDLVRNSSQLRPARLQLSSPPGRRAPSPSTPAHPAGSSCPRACPFPSVGRSNSQLNPLRCCDRGTFASRSLSTIRRSNRSFHDRRRSNRPPRYKPLYFSNAVGAAPSSRNPRHSTSCGSETNFHYHND